MKKALGVFLAVVIALVVGFGAGFWYAHYSQDKFDPILLDQDMKEISELATYECDYTEQVNYNGEAKKIFGKSIPFTSKSMQMVFKGSVKAGPDLMDNYKIDYDEATNTATVTIPHSKILSHEVDEDSIQIIGIKNGVFNFVTPKDSNAARKDAKKAKEKSILKSDFLKQADVKAADQIKTFLKTAHPDLNVEVVFK